MTTAHSSYRLGDLARRPGLPESFPRKYWLKRRRLIRPLFDQRRQDVYTLTAGSIRILARLVPREETGRDAPIQVGFAAGRRARNAVERNYIRRLLRETFRRNHQHELLNLFEDRPGTLTVMILFRWRPDQARNTIPRDLPRALDKFLAEL